MSFVTPYVTQYISKRERDIFLRIKGAVDRMEDVELKGVDEEGEENILSCHMLAHAAARVFPVKTVDGFFAHSYQHSWVITEEGHIIDLYPVACLGGPILHEGSTGAAPSRRLYREDKDFYRERFSEKSFLESVEITVKALERALAV